MAASVESISRPYLISAQVYDLKKRYFPEKYYAYCIKTYWSNESKQYIYRRYSQFHQLKNKLSDMFKSESGTNTPEDRIIPLLPGKELFRNKTVAMKRVEPINEYCEKLIKLKKEISRSNLVLDFFTLTDEDITMHSDESIWTKPNNANDESNTEIDISKPIKPEEYLVIKSYKAKTKNEISVMKESKVFVIEKNLTGWWFIDTKGGQGYVPQCILEKKEDFKPIILEKAELHIVISDYEAKQSDELSIKKTDFVEVLTKCESGFWKVRLFNKKEGLVPSLCITKCIQNQSKPLNLLNSIRQKNLPEENLPEFDPLTLVNNDENNLESSTDSFSKSMPQVKEESAIVNKEAPKYPVPICGDGFTDDLVFSIANYNDRVGDGISFEEGQRFKVLRKDLSNGWWYVQNTETNIEGWAPSTYLAPKPKPGTKSTISSANFDDAEKEKDKLLLNAINIIEPKKENYIEVTKDILTDVKEESKVKLETDEKTKKMKHEPVIKNKLDESQNYTQLKIKESIPHIEPSMLKNVQLRSVTKDEVKKPLNKNLVVKAPVCKEKPDNSNQNIVVNDIKVCNSAPSAIGISKDLKQEKSSSNAINNNNSNFKSELEKITKNLEKKNLIESRKKLEIISKVLPVAPNEISKPLEEVPKPIQETLKSIPTPDLPNHAPTTQNNLGGLRLLRNLKKFDKPN